MHSEKNLLGVFLKDRRCKIASRFLYGRVLDVGCNAGELRAFLSPEQEYVGIDIAIKPAQKNFAFFSKSGFDDLSELKTFDSVALLAVIEHVEDYAGLIKNISKSLKKNGAFVITTPSKFGDFLHGFLSRIGLVSKEAAEGHQKILSLEELSGLLERAGYEVLTRKRFLFFTNQLIVGKKK